MKCLCCRTLISHTLDAREKALPAWVSKHLEQCDDCRSFFLSCTTMETRLRNDRPVDEPVFRRELAHRVMTTIGTSDHEPQTLPSRAGRSRAGLRFFRPIIVQAATAALIVGLLILHPSTNAPDSSVPISNAPIKDKPLTAAMNDLSSIGKKVMDRYIPLEKKDEWIATLSDPVHEEVDRLTEDAEALKQAIAEFAPLGAIIAKMGRMKNRASSFE